MTKLSLLILLIFSTSAYSQSFVFCPKIKIQNTFEIEGNAYIVFKDTRTYEKKLKEKCSKEEIILSFSDYLSTTFPKLKITLLNEAQYNDKPKDNEITYKIDISKYDVTFYTGMYVSNTKLNLTILDLRNGYEKYKYEFNGKGSQWNAFGRSSGKKASNSSFERAFNEFILTFKDGILGEFPEQKTVDFSSKTTKLRALKELLDDGVLTQEEFEIEKKKILEEN